MTDAADLIIEEIFLVDALAQRAVLAALIDHVLALLETAPEDRRESVQAIRMRALQIFEGMGAPGGFPAERWPNIAAHVEQHVTGIVGQALPAEDGRAATN